MVWTGKKLRGAGVSNRAGLIKKKIPVTRGGKTFQQTVWVRPGQAKPVTRVAKREKQHRETVTKLASARAEKPKLSKRTIVAQPVDYKPVKRVLDALNAKRRHPLKSHGEGHVTVINPSEYSSVLSKHLSKERIQEIAEQEGFRKAEFEVVGLGRAKAPLQGEVAESFFLVVKSPALTRIRKKIHDEFVAKGGKSSAFNPVQYEPHITVGFTHRDLHSSDGVRKDVSSIDHSYDRLVRRGIE